jgi:mannitol-1-phosphate 5-dehydrogenase
MALTGTRTYVGFGFGAIQAGLFLYEAFSSGAFHKLVVAEVRPDVVAAVRESGGFFRVNIAHRDRVEQAEVGPVEIEDPASEADRQRLVEAVAEAEEIGTAVPSVRNYVSAGPGSIHRILTAGLRKKVARGGPRAVVYAAENHNHAAEILEASVMDQFPDDRWESVRSQVRFLNTVIGKMSGTVSDSEEIQALGLSTITPTNTKKAFLVEAFNRILIPEIRFEPVEGVPPFHRGIETFVEKKDLIPFEEAKLYGHNATHALAAYLGAVRGIQYIAELRGFPEMMSFLRAAIVEESGEALIRKYAGVDVLFTPEGYRRYGDDLLTRMTNPFLRDTVERVGRDPERKLGWDDRLIGTMRMALREGVKPHRYALGAAAALARIDPSILTEGAASLPFTWEGKPALGEKRLHPFQNTSAAGLLTSLWHEAPINTEGSEAAPFNTKGSEAALTSTEDSEAALPEEREVEAVLRMVEKGRRQLVRWRDSGFQARVLCSGVIEKGHRAD